MNHSDRTNFPITYFIFILIIPLQISNRLTYSLKADEFKSNPTFSKIWRIKCIIKIVQIYIQNTIRD